MSLLKSQIKAPEKSTSDVVSYIDSDTETSNQDVDLIAEDKTSTFDLGDKFEKRKHKLQQDDTKRYVCGVCEHKFTAFSTVKKHLKVDHNLLKLVVLLKRKSKGVYQFVVSEAPKSKIAKKPGKRKSSGKTNDKSSSTIKMKKLGLHNIDSLTIAHVQDDLMFCALCKFSTKVRLNLVKHLQLHDKQQSAPQTKAVKSVPHLDTTEKHVDAYCSLSPQIDKSKEVEKVPMINALNPFVRKEDEAVHSTSIANSNVSKVVNATPPMDLKPWQCGLCEFKSKLLPEVVDHCAKEHQSKMQYKYVYCAYKTSNMENIKKHQSQSHTDRIANTFYSYYREGSVPDEPDGTPRWQKQRQKSGLPAAQVKAEILKNKETGAQSNSSKTSVTPTSTPITTDLVDLNIVKEDPEADPPEGHFGLLCEPNGLNYKCPLCKIVSEENREAMQSHLYEELQYRKWGCGFCSYKAFHKNGLKEHMNTEHRQYREPIELPVDSRVEIWIAKALDHQFLLIEKGRQNIAKQAVVNPSTVPKSKQAVQALASENIDQCDANNLQIMFGSFGEPEGMQFNCPKCNYKVRDETLMRDHLEIELHKIRWCCNSCTQKFQNYHEAQFHCRSEHPGHAARAVEAVRDGGQRSAWLSALLLTQKRSMAASTVPSETPGSLDMSDQNTAPENSLLVVRYEERIATPEVENANLVKMHSNDSDEDEQRLVIDEPTKVAVEVKQCIFCSFKCKDFKDFKEHINQHTNIKPYFCLYCDMNGHRKTLLKHLSDVHKGQPVLLITKTQRGLGPPLKSGSASPAASASPAEDDKLICLRCEKSFSDNDAKSHCHENVKQPFARKGDVVVKCCVCLRLHESIEAATAHHEACHPHESLNYAYYKLQSTKRSVFCCAYCEQQFKFWRDFKVHCKAIHSSLPLKFNKRNFSYRVDSGSDMSSINLSDDDESLKRKSDSPMEGPAPKRSAGKSTPKLPTQSVAKKSTAKLPLTTETESDKESTCNHGSEPSTGDLDNVRTRLNSCNTDIACTYKQLTEATKIDPVVLVKDVTK